MADDRAARLHEIRLRIEADESDRADTPGKRYVSDATYAEMYADVDAIRRDIRWLLAEVERLAAEIAGCHSNHHAHN